MIHELHGRLLGFLMLAALATGAWGEAAEQADAAAVEPTGTEQPEAEAGGEAGDAAGETAEAADTAGKPDGEAQAAGNGASADVFVPTEEISEDYAVSFPVDI